MFFSPQCLTLPMDPNMNFLTIKDLIRPDVKVWNSPLISTLFPTNIANLIMDTPLIESCQEDAFGVKEPPISCVRTGCMLDRSIIGISFGVWKSHPRCAVSFGGCARTVSPPHKSPVRLRDKGVPCTSLCAVCNGGTRNCCLACLNNLLPSSTLLGDHSF